MKNSRAAAQQVSPDLVLEGNQTGVSSKANSSIKDYSASKSKNSLDQSHEKQYQSPSFIKKQ